MKNALKSILIIFLLLFMTACNKGDKTNITDSDKPGENITVIEETQDYNEQEAIRIEKIDRFEKVNITDWLDENTVVASKENASLDKMKLAELADKYPRSIYLLDIITKDYSLIKEQENAFLEAVGLSPDKKYLLYYLYDLGDPSFYCLNTADSESFAITGDPIGGAISAKWADNDSIIGAAYSGGAYLADPSGKITLIDELKDEALYLVEKVNNSIFYNTQYDGTLIKLDLNTGEKLKLGIENVFALLPSPDGKQMIILQAAEERNILLVYDLISGEKTVIAEGIELSGVSRSPDQRYIAYNLTEVKNGNTTSSLYVYDLLDEEATQLLTDTAIIRSLWSPTGKKLLITDWDGEYYNSGIIYFVSEGRG